MKPLKDRHWESSGVFIFNFKQIQPVEILAY